MGYKQLCQARTHHRTPTLHDGFLRRRRPRALDLPDPPPCGPRSDTPNLVRNVEKFPIYVVNKIRYHNLGNHAGQPNQVVLCRPKNEDHLSKVLVPYGNDNEATPDIAKGPVSSSLTPGISPPI